MAAAAASRGSVRALVGFDTAGGRGTAADVAGNLAGTGSTVERTYSTLPLLDVDATPAGIAALTANPHVTSLAVDGIRHPTDTTSTELVGGTAATKAGYDGSGSAIAILDTGVDSSHPYLAGKVVAEACFSHGTCPNHGSTQIGPGAAAPCGITSICFHGTHVAGIAAGRHTTGASYDGVAPGAKIVSVQVFTNCTTDLCGYDSDVIAGLDWVRSVASTYNIVAANLSLGGGLYSGDNCDDAPEATPYKDAIDALRSVGVITAVAAGNENSADAIGLPACVSSAVAVGATTKSDEIATFTDSSPAVDVWAPGVGITSSVLFGRFATYSGTSMATPHVAGAIAVMAHAGLGAAVDDRVALLESSGPTITDARNGVARHRIDLRAMTPAVTATATAADGGATLAWSAPLFTADSFRIVAQPGGRTTTAGGAASSVRVSGLSNGVTYTFTVTPVWGTTAGGTATANAVTPQASVSLYDRRTPEGTTTPRIANVYVKLKRPSTVPVSVDWTTGDGVDTATTFGAIADQDYVAASGTATIAPRGHVAVIPIQIVPDTVRENLEYFTVHATAAVNGTLVKADAIVRIVNDDA